MASKRVVIVGAGPSGLVALKEMVEAGHEACIVEQSHVIGGVFSTLAESAYDGLYLTISNVFMAYSDFPCEEGYIKYSKKEEYAQYLHRYAAHFGLNEKIRLETRVKKASLGPEGKWRIVTSAKDGTEATMEGVDSLIVCTGSNQTPKKTPENVAKFGGEILHSSSFQNPDGFAGKRVLIIGTGESASDIACDIAGVAAETTIWARRPFILAPRYTASQHMKPDYDEAEWLETESRWRDCRVGDFLEQGTTSRLLNACPLWIYGGIRQFGWKMMSTMKGVGLGVNHLGRLSKACTSYKGVDPSIYFRADQAAWVTKNARIADMAGRRALEVVVAPVAEFSGTKVAFKGVLQDPVTSYRLDEPIEMMERDFDTVVCCTGYTNDFPFLETDPSFGELCTCPRSWYKHCWPPGFGDKLAFVGWARPHQGGIPQTSELCSRYHALVLRGDKALPENIRELTAAESQIETEYYALSPNLTSLVDWPSFSVSLSRMIGCEPDTPSVLFSPITFLKYWFYPMWPCWYRLKGPGAKPSTFNVVMDRFPFFKSGVLLDPVALFAAPIAPIQKFVINILSYLLHPFKPLTGYSGLSSVFDRSKFYILHGADLRLKGLFTWSI
mmetsp:Transcript_18685/g.58766  ORF Transcript_18685/g.58766 Transcript_18685/m.58766 type:complete len:612 (-) Transcript_18685:524-2359(-)